MIVNIRWRFPCFADDYYISHSIENHIMMVPHTNETLSESLSLHLYNAASPFGNIAHHAPTILRRAAHPQP